VASPPIDSLPGYEIKKMPRLRLTDLSDYEDSQDSFNIGIIADQGHTVAEASFFYRMAIL